MQAKKYQWPDIGPQVRACPQEPWILDGNKTVAKNLNSFYSNSLKMNWKLNTSPSSCNEQIILVCYSLQLSNRSNCTHRALKTTVAGPFHDWTGTSLSQALAPSRNQMPIVFNSNHSFIIYNTTNTLMSCCNTLFIWSRMVHDKGLTNE